MQILWSEMKNPRRRSIVAPWLILSAAALFVGGATAQTTVAGSLSDAMGITSTNKLTASCSLASTATFVAGTGAVVTASTGHVVAVTGGQFSAALLPTDGASAVLARASYAMTCHIPLQTADGRNCEGSASLISQGVCVVGAQQWGPVYLLVPTSNTPVDLKDWYRVKKPTGITWGELLSAGITWGRLLNGN